MFTSALACDSDPDNDGPLDVVLPSGDLAGDTRPSDTSDQNDSPEPSDALRADTPQIDSVDTEGLTDFEYDAGRDAGAGPEIDTQSDTATDAGADTADAGENIPGSDTGACTLGRRDCNGQSSDGCEVDLATDPDNCGTCGLRCGVGTSCRDGRCLCQTDDRCGNECTDFSRDPENCGGCDNACSFAQLCEDGACSAAACEACAETNCGALCFPRATCDLFYRCLRSCGDDGGLCRSQCDEQVGGRAAYESVEACACGACPEGCGYCRE